MVEKKTAQEPYTPWGLQFPTCNWEYTYGRPKTFSNFFVTLKNSTPNNFNRIKFRLKIYDTSGNRRKEVFSKIIERNGSVYAEDVVRYEIMELRNFYVGSNISDKDNFDWTTEIIDAKPRPGYEDLSY